MESLNVLVAASIGDECQRQVADVSPRVKPRDLSDLLAAEPRGDFQELFSYRGHQAEL